MSSGEFSCTVHVEGLKSRRMSRSERARVVTRSASSNRARPTPIELKKMERDPMEMALSTDIVMDIILSHLKTGDLLRCRKVSKFWNKSASSVLRKRSTLMKNISETKDLMELEACMKKSSDFPFAGLTFRQPWRLNTAGAMKFFKKYGATFTSLRLDIRWTIRLEDLAPFINHLPRLSILEAGPSYGRSPPTELLNSAAGQEDGRILNLPSLRIFRISFQVNEDVLVGVLAAATASLRIECLSATRGILRALQSAGKLQAVTAMTVKEIYYEHSEDLRMAELLSVELPALTKVDFNAGGCMSMTELKKILISSRNTLKELRLARVCPSELTWDYPVFNKLTALTLCLADRSHECIFQGRHGHSFPALKELELDIVYAGHPTIAKVSDGLFIVPSLRVVHLEGHVDKDKMQGFARSFPNVTEIRLTEYDSGWQLETDPLDIWSVGAFKFLEKLSIWDYMVKRPTKNFVNMDSFLTGIPTVICENLRKLPQMDLTASPFNEVLRGGQSLLQLKNLKELTVCVSRDRDTLELPDDPPFISMVSVWYALEMMPNLQAKFMYEYESPSPIFFEDQQRDKAVFKAAFKHVRVHIKLEPFFY